MFGKRRERDTYSISVSHFPYSDTANAGSDFPQSVERENKIRPTGRAGTGSEHFAAPLAPHAFKTGRPAVNHAVKAGTARSRSVTAEVSVRPSVRRLVVAATATWFLRQNYAAAAAAAARRPGEFMNGRSLLTDRASITLSLMARDGGRTKAGEGQRTRRCSRREGRR